MNNLHFRSARAKSSILIFFSFLEFSYKELKISLNIYVNHIKVAYFTLY